MKALVSDICHWCHMYSIRLLIVDEIPDLCEKHQDGKIPVFSMTLNKSGFRLRVSSYVKVFFHTALIIQQYEYRLLQ